MARPDSTVWDLSQLHLDDQERVVELQDMHMPKDNAIQAKKHALISTCVGLQRKPTQYEKIDWHTLAEAFLPDLVPHLLNTQEDGTPRAYFADPLTCVWSEMSTDGNTATTPLYRMIQTLLQELTTLSRTITERDVVGWKAVHAALNTRLCHEALWLSPREEMDDPIELLHKRDRDGDRFDRICETVLLHRVREFERAHPQQGRGRRALQMRLRHAAGNAAPGVYPHDQSAVDGRHRHGHADAAPRRAWRRVSPRAAPRRAPAHCEHTAPAATATNSNASAKSTARSSTSFARSPSIAAGRTRRRRRGAWRRPRRSTGCAMPFHRPTRARLRLLIESQTNQFEGPGGMVDNLTAFSRALFGDYRAAMASSTRARARNPTMSQAGDGGKSYGEAVRKRVFDSAAHRTDTYSAVMDLSTIAEKGTRAAGSTTTHLKNLDLKRCAQINECKAGAVVNEYMYNKIVPHQDDPEVTAVASSTVPRRRTR